MEALGSGMQRQVYGEGASLFRGTLDLNGAAMGFSNGLRDAQSQA